jgi:hypothetical protein
LGDYQRALMVPAVAAGLAVLVGLVTWTRHRTIVANRVA